MLVPLHVVKQRLFQQAQVYQLQYHMYSASGTVRLKNDEKHQQTENEGLYLLLVL